MFTMSRWMSNASNQSFASLPDNSSNPSPQSNSCINPAESKDKRIDCKIWDFSDYRILVNGWITQMPPFNLINALRWERRLQKLLLTPDQQQDLPETVTEAQQQVSCDWNTHTLNCREAQAWECDTLAVKKSLGWHSRALPLWLWDSSSALLFRQQFQG